MAGQGQAGGHGDAFGGLPQATWGRGGRTLRVSVWECAAMFWSLNSKIPSLSNVAYKSRIWGRWHPQTCRSMWGTT